jgi:hypothetical protein
MFATRATGARLIAGGLIATTVLATAVGAEAATKKKSTKVVKHTRTVTLTYNGGCTIEVPVGAAAPGQCAAIGAASYDLTAQKGEQYVSVSVSDGSGQTVPGQFWITGSSVGGDTEIPFCGSLKDFKFPVASFSLDLDAIGLVASCPGAATSGTIKLTFSNLP